MKKKVLVMILLAGVLAGSSMTAQAAPLKGAATQICTASVVRVENVDNATDLTAALKKAYQGETVEIVLRAGATVEIEGEQTIYSNVTINLNGGTIKATNAAKGNVLYIKSDTENVAIYGGNIVASGNQHGIYVNNARNVNVHDLNISGYADNGIYAASSTLADLTNIAATGGNGGVYLNGSPAGAVSGCTFNNNATYGIRINGCTVGDITGNTISGVKATTQGLYITDDAITGAISTNTISNCYIALYPRSSTMGAISSNTFTNNGDAIYLANDSVANGSITANVIDTFDEVAIQLYTQCKVNGNIDNNVIRNGKGTGILLTGPTDDKGGSPTSGSVVTGNIQSNTITNCTGDGIGVYHASYCQAITGNVLDTIGGNHNGNEGDYGIIVDSMMKAKTYCSEISYNSIANVTYAGIAVYSGPSASTSKIYQDTAYVSGDIYGNTLTNCGCYQASKDWKEEIAKGWKKGCLSGIYVDTHARVYGDIHDNVVDKTNEHGIYIHLMSYVNNIYKNTVKDTKEAGIEIYRSTVLGDIYENTLSNSGTFGMKVIKYSDVKGKIRNNLIDKGPEGGIYVDASKVNIISENTLKGVKKSGIGVADSSTAQLVELNSVAMSDQATGIGIQVSWNSKVKTVSKNKVSGKMAYGIKYDSVLVDSTVTGNTLTTKNAAKKLFSPIYVTGSKSKTITIKDNSVTGNKSNYGIRLMKGKAVIDGNTIKNTTYPIYIVDNKNAVTVSNNTIKGNKTNAIKTTKNKYTLGAMKLASVKAGSKSATLKWKKAGGCVKYVIYQSDKKDGTYKQVGTTKAERFVAKKLKKGQVYYFKICGVRQDGKISVYTGMSAPKSIKSK